MTTTTETTKVEEKNTDVTVNKTPRFQPVRRSRTNRKERPRSEFDQVTIDVRRVARVVAGGRRFSFSVTLVIGDHKGRVGVGVGKGADTALAIEKATRNARRNLIQIQRTKSDSIQRRISAKYSASNIIIIPSAGRGMVTGSAMRVVLELAGITDVIGKILSRSKNKLTIARATIKALKSLKTSGTFATTLKTSDTDNMENSHNAELVVL